MSQSACVRENGSAPVLILDDDLAALEEIEEVLELEDIRAVTASDIETALAHLSRDPRISVIVSDMHLISADGIATRGIEFIYQAREAHPTRPLNFIVLSGDAGAIASSIETGAVDFLTKPLMPDALLHAVRWASIPDAEPEADLSSLLMRKVTETTKSLQRVSVDLAARELELSESREAFDRRRLEGGKLREGLSCGHIVPWFQPQVCARTGKVLGFEALVRWNDPKLGVQNPAEFLPLAQEIGLLTTLDQEVQRKAFDALATFHHAGVPGCDIGVNLTAAQLADPSCVDHLCLQIEQAGLEQAHVSVEILEAVMLDEDEAAPIKANISRLSALGLGIELDDFGTGHAGLSSLRDLAVTRIKIDRSFVRDVHQDSTLQKFTRALIGLAKALDIAVLAEGVETEDEYRWLAAEGCDAMQGFYIAHPMPAEDALIWAQSSAQGWAPSGHDVDPSRSLAMCD